MTLSRHGCRRCGGFYWSWQSIFEHKPECLYRREALAAVHAAALEEDKRRP